MAISRAKTELAEALGLKIDTLAVEYAKNARTGSQELRDSLNRRITAVSDTSQIIQEGLDAILLNLKNRGLEEPEESLLFLAEKVSPSGPEIQGTLLSLSPDDSEGVVSVKTTALTLSPNDKDVFQALMRSQGHPIRTKDLYKEMYGHEPSERELHTFSERIRHFRKSLSQEGSFILTSGKQGYEIVTREDILKRENEQPRKRTSATEKENLYSIADAARITNLSVFTIKNYAKANNLDAGTHYTSSKSKPGGIYKITDAGLDRLRLIRQLTGGKRESNKTIKQKLFGAIDNLKKLSREKKLRWQDVRPFTFEEEARLANYILLSSPGELNKNFGIKLSDEAINEAKKIWQKYEELPKNNESASILKELCLRVEKKLLSLAQDPKTARQMRFANETRPEYLNLLVTEVLLAMEKLGPIKRQEFIKDLVNPKRDYLGDNSLNIYGRR